MTTTGEKILAVKAFVNDNGMTSISCPVCGLVRETSVAKFRNQRHVLAVKCKCNTTFKVHLEFRKFFRKNTDLEGVYTILPPDSGGGRIQIKNISRSGIGFSVSGKHFITTGQSARIIFTLDNRKNTALDKMVVIKSVRENYIGCAFVENQEFEKELGFYLRP